MDPTNHPDPLAEKDDDPGDETQRNFRYQHAWGVYLLIKAWTGDLPYKAVYCEHHEDLFCKRTDGTYDAWQVKTRKPENGYWQLNHTPLKKSIKRFASLVAEYSGQINQVYFISNSESLTTKSKQKKHLSPIKLSEAVGAAGSHDDLASPFAEAFANLLEYCDCEARVLFATLSRLCLEKGPSREEYEAAISHTYLGGLEECKRLPRAKLNDIRDELISSMHRASSLSRDDPAFNWITDPDISELPPEVQAKRVHVSTVEEAILSYDSTPFRYLDGTSTLTIEEQSAHDLLACKLERGGLADQFRTMERRVLSTEARLIENSYMSNDDGFDSTLDQLEGVVQAVCDDADLEAEGESSRHSRSFGRAKMRLVNRRLREITKHEPSSVDDQPYEVLVGMAGLLTEECSVWWSPRFDTSECE